MIDRLYSIMKQIWLDRIIDRLYLIFDLYSVHLHFFIFRIYYRLVNIGLIRSDVTVICVYFIAVHQYLRLQAVLLVSELWAVLSLKRFDLILLKVINFLEPLLGIFNAVNFLYIS